MDDRPRTIEPSVNPRIPGNFSKPVASNTMSSISGAEFEADFPNHDSGQASAAPPANPTVAREMECLRKARQGDRAAYGQLVVLYQDRLYNAVLRLVGDVDDAREVTQETFTRGLAKIDGFRGDAAPYTWLFRIAMNLAISSLRKGGRHRTFSLDGSNGRQSNGDENGSSGGLIDRLRGRVSDQPEHAAERRERDEQVLAALGRVDPEYRAVLVMRDVEGFDYQQMADVLGMPLGTLKSRLFRARLALRDELMPYLEEGERLKGKG
jgi:RNA polymerase sigma-70 factor, ECF subfamily